VQAIETLTLSDLPVGAHFKLGTHGCAGYDTFKLVQGRIGPEILHLEHKQIVRLGPQAQLVLVPRLAAESKQAEARLAE
jgi:hypothetical protein